ncbi:MAG TPA: FAD-dependent oxidoreductase [Prosthecobacter sp.]|nr:FAD-dependent oxidoreductase [Prosthecobacter sp.]
MTDAADIIVAGGGSAGIAAALAAARAGARTVLLERQSTLGGMGSHALVHTFCGLYHPDVSQGPRFLNGGIAEEIGLEMMRRTGQTGPDLMGRVYVLRQHPTLFAGLADELCRAEGNLKRVSGAEWVALTREDGGWRIEMMNQGLRRTLKCRAVVDTTGDATGARLLNPALCEQAEGARLYRPAYVCVFHEVRPLTDDNWRLTLGAAIVRAVKEGRLPGAAMGSGFRASPFAGEVFLTIDLEAGEAHWDPFDPVKRAQVEEEGRGTALALWRFLRAEQASFQGCPPPMLPAQAGIRESARYRGDYVITGEDLAASRQFEDNVALAGWPMEKRENARGPKFRYFDRPEPAGIPARCLKNSGVPGLFFAGRCLSADHEALASLRVMGTCMATGEAAGKLAVDFVAGR